MKYKTWKDVPDELAEKVLSEFPSLYLVDKPMLGIRGKMHKFGKKYHVPIVKKTIFIYEKIKNEK